MKKVISVFLTVFLTIYMITNVSIGYDEQSSHISLQNDFTDDFKRYMSLPEEERNKYIVPNEHEIKYIPESKKIETKDRKFNLYSLRADEVIPDKYDLRDYNLVTPVKDQGRTGICWAFSTMASLESNLLKKSNRVYDLSEVHLLYSASADLTTNNNKRGVCGITANSGGDFRYAVPYFMNGVGPVNEQDNGKIKFVSQENYPVIDIEDLNTYKSEIEVNDIIFFGDARDVSTANKVKKHIMNNGAVVAYIYVNGNFYNQNTAAYFYNGDEIVNHAICIVGWDNNYSKDNFLANNKPENDGAWIVKNSYGESFGDNGYFYVSYEDKKINDVLYGIENALTNTTYDNIYEYDDLFAREGLGYRNDRVVGANIFKKGTNVEFLNRVSVMVRDESYCKVYIYYNNEQNNRSDFIDVTNYVKERKINSEGYILVEPGYHSFRFDDFPIPLYGNNFVVAVEIYNPSGNAEFAVERKFADNNLYDNINSNVGESFLARTIDAEIWSDVKDIDSDLGNIGLGNIGLKAFTTNNMDISKFTITGFQNTLVYGQKQNIQLSAGLVALEEGIDYTISYINNGNAGTETMVITPMGSYTGNPIEKTFTIVPKDINSNDILASLEENSYIFDETPKTPQVAILDKTLNKNLIENVDYTITYENNINAGTAKVIITPKGNYGGSPIEKTFTIVPKNINSNDILASLEQNNYNFDGLAKTPKVTILDKTGNKNLIENVDYTITYENNINAGTAKVIITPKGNYSGSPMEKTFGISAKDINSEDITVSNEQTELDYDGTPKAPEINIMDNTRQYKLIKDVDYYIVTRNISDTTNTNKADAGNYEMSVIGKNNYKGEILKNFVINKVERTGKLNILGDYFVDSKLEADVNITSEYGNTYKEDGNIQYQWWYTDSKDNIKKNFINGATSKEYKIEDKYKNYYIGCDVTITGSKNYNDLSLSSYLAEKVKINPTPETPNTNQGNAAKSGINTNQGNTANSGTSTNQGNTANSTTSNTSNDSQLLSKVLPYTGKTVGGGILLTSIIALVVVNIIRKK